jgi:hypothetical protein
MAKSSRTTKTTTNESAITNSRTTVSGPGEPDASGIGEIVAEKAAGTHCKPILAVGAGDQLLTACGIAIALPNGQPDPGVITTPDACTASDGFIAAIAKHRHLERETDPSRG